jgi:predicted RNase H-related nuclease YkuK (DUF458 family)
LIAKAQRTDSVAEADSLMAKATDILRAHNMEIGDINATEDVITKDKIKELKGWKITLYTAICYPNMVTLIKSSKTGYYLVGKRSNIETVNFLHEFYCNAVTKLAEMYWQNEGQHRYSNKSACKNEFLKGCAAGVGRKLQRENKLAIETVAGLKDLILVNDIAIKSYLGDIKKATRKQNVYNATAYLAGVKAVSGITTGVKMLTA